MQSREGKAEELTFRYVRAEDYRRIVISGVWGGFTPNGLIEADFFFDTFPVPDTVTYDVTADGNLGDEKTRSYQNEGDRVHPMRHIEVGILLDADLARSVAKWLENKADELDKIRKEGQRREC